MSDFDSKIGMDTANDETFVEEVIKDEELLKKFYNSPSFDDYKLDFGGGIFGITCRSVIKVSGNKPKVLAQIIGIPTNKVNLDNMKILLSDCKSAVENAAYLT